jgi:hypothetical protein
MKIQGLTCTPPETFLKTRVSDSGVRDDGEEVIRIFSLINLSLRFFFLQTTFFLRERTCAKTF